MEAFRNGLPASDQVFGFALVESRRLDQLFQFGRFGSRKFLRTPISLEQGRRDLIDALIRTLSRKDCGDEQLPRRVMAEFHLCDGYRVLQDPSDS